MLNTASDVDILKDIFVFLVKEFSLNPDANVIIKWILHQKHHTAWTVQSVVWQHWG